MFNGNIFLAIALKMDDAGIEPNAAGKPCPVKSPKIDIVYLLQKLWSVLKHRKMCQMILHRFGSEEFNQLHYRLTEEKHVMQIEIPDIEFVVCVIVSR